VVARHLLSAKARLEERLLAERFPDAAQRNAGPALPWGFAGTYSARSMLGGWPPRIILFVLAVAATACGGAGHPSKTQTTDSTATTGPAPAAVSVTPTAGPVGTSFTLTATHFHPGESLRFEIHRPDGKIFKGPLHPVPADGTVSAPYKTTGDNRPGDYTVTAATDKGTTAQGTFRLTSSTPPSNSAPTKAGSSSTTTAPRISTTIR